MNQKTFYHIIEWAVALAACVFLGYKLVTFEDYPALWESLRGMAWQHYLALGLCVALMPVNMAIEAWRWMTLWNEGVKERSGRFIIPNSPASSPPGGSANTLREGC